MGIETYDMLRKGKGRARPFGMRYIKFSERRWMCSNSDPAPRRSGIAVSVVTFDLVRLA